MKPHSPAVELMLNIELDPINKDLRTFCVQHEPREMESDQPIMESDLSDTDLKLLDVNSAFPGINRGF